MQSFLALSLGAAILGGNKMYGVPVKSFKPRRREEILPTGTKKYFFSKEGEWWDSPKSIPHVFECIASNPKNAIRKFNNFKKTQECKK
jgi:hypothetical protein